MNAAHTSAHTSDLPRARHREHLAAFAKPRWQSACRTAFVRGAGALLLAALACSAAAEKFVSFGEQPDGTEIFVQAAPAAVRKDGRLQGWFRTLRKTPTAVTDDSGVDRLYQEMLALNVAECSTRRMGAASMTYRDDKGVAVATFAAAPIAFRDVKRGTLAESMFAWLCEPKPRSAAPPPSAASQSPFR